ncbi:MAG: glycosyltransferase [Armatimonadetes bacterium]|nr:glycosyltransferase [Armatimonadota bacterium]
MADDAIRLSVVIPLYNEEENVPELLRRLDETLATIQGPVELVLVDDGSRDRTVEQVRAFEPRSMSIVLVELARNAGQHNAILAGFSQCRGQYVVTLDADLQNPPEEIPRVLEQLEAGYAVVGTVRRDRNDPLPRRLASRVVNKLVSRATGHDLHDYGCMLRGYSRETVQAMLACPERHTFIPALAMAVAGSSTEIEVSHAPRAAGQSKYDLGRLLRLNFDLMMGFTSIPLELVSCVGLVTALLGLVFSVFLIVRRIVHGPEVEGVFTLFAILFFFIGVQILALGLVGEYIARMYDEIRGRPRYLVRRVYRNGGRRPPPGVPAEGED